MPPAVAPYHVVIVPIYYSSKERDIVIKFAESIKKNLEKKFRVIFDKDEQHSPGWKYNYWEMKGVPIRIEIGPRDVKSKQVVLSRRDEKKKVDVKESKLISVVENSLDAIQKNLRANADAFFKSKISDAKSFQNLKKKLEEKGGLVRINWCGGGKCADEIKSQTNGGTIRGTLFNKKETVKGVCLVCGEKANSVVYVAKQY